MAKKQALLLQMEFFNEMSRAGLSPDQYYLICCMKDSISPIGINTNLELRRLNADTKFIKQGEKRWELTPQSLVLIEKLERLFVITKKKTSGRLMGKDFKENIAIYRDMFPNKKLPSGKQARSAPKNLETAFRWFFDNYDYDWKTIFRATKKYVNEHQKKGDKFMRTSQFYIRKNNMSDLADGCDAVLSGSDQEEERLHSVKVV